MEIAMQHLSVDIYIVINLHAGTSITDKDEGKHESIIR